MYSRDGLPVLGWTSWPGAGRAPTATQDAGLVCVQLDAVTFIDAAGKELLRTMHTEGATLAASACMTRAILEEIGKNW